jgi:hypothetical protein
MTKIFTAFFVLCVVVATAQNNNLMNYNGHWYAPNASSLDKEALGYQQLLKEKASFDSLAKSLDVFVNRSRFTNTMNDLPTDEKVTGNVNVSMLQKDFRDMVDRLKNIAQGNDEYRRVMNYHISRVLKARREGWSDELYAYVMHESIGILYNYFNAKANTDAGLRNVVAEMNADERYQKCSEKITADDKMMDDPNMQLFICDRMEYVMGADIYRYRESTPGVVTNYAKRKKESTDLYGWLFQRATADMSGTIMLADFNHNAGSKANEAILKLRRSGNWYVFLFYKGALYYSDALPNCATGNGLNIPFKQ